MNTTSDASEIIKTHCGDLRERIRACRSKTIAEQLRTRLCDELSRHCHSEIVQGVLKRHLDTIIEETFDHHGNNTFLEAL